MKRAILSPFFVIISRYWLTMPPIECSPGAARAGEKSLVVARRVAREVAAIAIERMARDVEAERLLLEREQLLGAPHLDLGIGLALRAAARLPRPAAARRASNSPNSDV